MTKYSQTWQIITLSYEKSTGPRGGRRNRGPRRARARNAALQVRDCEVRPSGGRPPLADGEGPRALPESGFHPESGRPVRGSSDSGHGRSRGRQRDPVLPNFAGRAATGSGASQGVGQRLTAPCFALKGETDEAS